MRKVRYTNVHRLHYPPLVDGGVYDVIRYIPSSSGTPFDKIKIYRDGKACIYDLYSFDIGDFEDVTTEYRNEVIDGILS